MKPWKLLILATGLCLLAIAGQAGAVSKVDDGVLITFDGHMSPKRLPRHTAAPVAVTVGGDIKSSSGNSEQVPQLRKIKVEINRGGRLFDRGLPVCNVAEIQPSTQAAARRICGGAIVGSGHVTVQVHLSPQPPFIVRAKLLAFNGPRRNGVKRIFAQAYARTPPGAFVLTFTVTKEKGGEYGTVLSTTLPPETTNWAYLKHFDMTLHRVYEYRGRTRSYVSAACPAPSGFFRAPYSFARATYGFTNGQKLTVAESGVCHVAR